MEDLLTNHEHDILICLCAGLTSKETAKILRKSANAVTKTLERVRIKLEAATTYRAIHLYTRWMAQ